MGRCGCGSKKGGKCDTKKAEDKNNSESKKDK